MSEERQAPSATPQSADGRSTTFQPVTGEQEHYSGEALLVSAYAVLWVILFAWVALGWRRQSTLDARLDDLEREIEKADGKARP
jgi:hypothetical protein